jgi:hypothetical protein
MISKVIFQRGAEVKKVEIQGRISYFDDSF